MWRRITSAFELDERELLVLAQAARQADDIAALQAALRKHGTTSTGVAGQLKVSPLVPELRQARQALAKLLDTLDLPPLADAGTAGAPPPGSGQSSAGLRLVAPPARSAASRKASKAARSRWAREQRGAG